MKNLKKNGGFTPYHFSKKNSAGFIPHHFSKKNSEGFTLIEILVVIGIIAILAVIVLIAINPARQFAQARNTQRTSNVNAILNGIGQYVADHKGDNPPGLPAPGSSVDAIDLCNDLLTDYLPALPSDPDSSLDGAEIEKANCGTASSTDYMVSVNASSTRVTVDAHLHQELGEVIDVTR